MLNPASNPDVFDTLSNSRQTLESHASPPRRRLLAFTLTLLIPVLLLLSPTLSYAFNANWQATPNPTTGNFTLSWTAPPGGFLFLEERFNGG